MPSVCLNPRFSALPSTRNCYISVWISLCFPPLDQSWLTRSRKEKVCCTASAHPPGSILLHHLHRRRPCVCASPKQCSLTPEVFITNTARHHRRQLPKNSNVSLLVRSHTITLRQMAIIQSICCRWNALYLYLLTRARAHARRQTHTRK